MIYVSKIINEEHYTVMHTEETDISFQKTAWSEEKREQNLLNAFTLCKEAGIKAEANLAVVGFNQDDLSCREVFGPDPNVIEKIPGNILITESDVCLMAWAADCCLVALAGDDGKVIAVLHASVKTFKNGVIDLAMAEMRKRGVKDIVAYVGICAGACCYEYSEEDAKVDFADWPGFVLWSPTPGKVKLDLQGAVRASLRRQGAAQVFRIFPELVNSCNICARDGEKYIFPSYRREKGKNGQYGLFICKK